MLRSGALARRVSKHEAQHYGRTLRDGSFAGLLRVSTQVASLLLQEQRAFLLHRRHDYLRDLGEEPRQLDIQLHMALRHLNGAGDLLRDGAHAECKRVVRPVGLLDAEYAGELSARIDNAFPDPA